MTNLPYGKVAPFHLRAAAALHAYGMLTTASLHVYRCHAVCLDTGVVGLREEIVKNSRTMPLERLKRICGGRAQLAALHKFSAVPPGGAFWDVVLAPFGNPEPRMRMQTTAFYSVVGILRRHF